ncbi:MAG: hypothetical protein U9M97_03115 [Candidatus Hadarchaeota archaeon]|nr:hypothetical protein [Candidatus Hadarchaeota archaeon]
MKKVLLLIVLSIGLFGLHHLSFALQISQIEFDLILTPGETRTFSFQVRNDIEDSQRISVYLGDWDRDSLGNNQFFELGTIDRSLCPWLSVNPTSFTLGPDEVQEVTGTLMIPASGEGSLNGTYWGIIFVQGEPRPMETKGATVLAIERFGVKVYGTMAGAGPRRGKINGVENKGQTPLWLWVKFINSGIVNLDQITGWVEVLDSSATSVAKLDVEGFSCLPGYERWVRVNTDLNLSAGEYLIMAVLDIGADNLIGGRQTLRIQELSLEPIGGAGALPQDLDGDGLYEDINGDSLFDTADSQLFLVTFDQPVVQRNFRAFDFNNDGIVGWNDVSQHLKLLND